MIDEEKRSVIRNGGNLSINLPADWCREFCVKKGQLLNVERGRNGVLKIYKSQEPEAKKDDTCG